MLSHFRVSVSTFVLVDVGTVVVVGVGAYGFRAVAVPGSLPSLLPFGKVAYGRLRCATFEMRSAGPVTGQLRDH